MNNLLKQKELFILANVGQQSRLIKWLEKNYIKYKRSNDGEIFTTMKQIDNSFTSDLDEEIGDFGG